MKWRGKSYRARLVQDMRYKERLLLARLQRIEKRGLRSPLLYNMNALKWSNKQLKQANEYELEERISVLEDLGRKATSYVEGAQVYTDFVNEHLTDYMDYENEKELVDEIINKLFESPVGNYLGYLLSKGMISSEQIKDEITTRVRNGQSINTILTAFNEGLAKEQRGEGDFKWFSQDTTRFKMYNK